MRLFAPVALPAGLALALAGCATARGRPSPPAEPQPSQGCAPDEFIGRASKALSVRKGVVYSRPSDPYGVHSLRMDVYRPKEDAPRARPAIVWVHGGFFKRGDRGGLRELAKEFARRGYVTATIDYRLLRVAERGARVVPAAETAQSDAQAAIRFLRLHAAELGLDPARIAIGGHSAGSVTAFQVGYRHELLGDNTDNPGPEHTVSAVVGIEGYIIGPEDIQPGDPPFLLFRSGRGHGRDAGPEVPPPLERAHELGIPAETLLLEDATHEGLIQPPFVRTVVSRALPFLRRFVACPELAGAPSAAQALPTQRMISGNVGRLPYMRIPTR
jgi:hypothetical protein